jgi:uncharacterized membrane protein YeaQ/YmgE (transglycosylase-associated protein family)
MKDFLTHIWDWRTIAPSLSGADWLLLLPLLACATVIFNSMTGTSDPLGMVTNFVWLLAGAVVGTMLFPDLSPLVDPASNFALAFFCGMTGTALISFVLFRRG